MDKIFIFPSEGRRRYITMSKAFWFLTAITVYLAAMIFVGLRSARKTRSTDDFYLGGRRLGPWVTAMSAEASDMSS